VPQNEWVYISAKERIWFRVGETLRNLTIGLEVGDEPGLQMSVYSPEQGDVLSASPIGHGTRENGFDLWYSGTSRGKGSWYVRFDNPNDHSLPYKLTATTRTDSGVEYLPDVLFAFGTGNLARVAPAPKPVAADTHTAPAPAAPAPVIPGSPDPWNAPMPSGQLTHIAPHTTVWYAVSDRARRLSVMMQADRNLGLEMWIYGPDRTDVWSSPPTGRGAPGGGFPYFWTGRARFKGIWKIRIINPNDFSVPYTLISQNVSDMNGDLCRDCHGAPQDDQWDSCEHEGSFCEDLRKEATNQDQ
jgi:hypothetical protein